MKIFCAICNEHISTADPLTLHRPLSGAMFASPDLWHGFAPPFDPGTEWLGMLCPYCRHRPFITEDEVLTEDGIYKVPEIPADSEHKEEKNITPPEDGPVIESDPVMDFKDYDRWEPKACEVCGKVVKGAGPLASHMRVHE